MTSKDGIDNRALDVDEDEEVGLKQNHDAKQKTTDIKGIYT